MFNGEIHNVRELRTELEGHGVRREGSGDAEVVARAVAHWGADAFARWGGMFAIAAYHRESRACLLTRDRFGEKPLYLWQRDGSVAFASEPRASTTWDRRRNAVDELDRRLRIAVESRLVADVEVGVLLSGGIDSSLVATHAAAVHPGVHTFSVAVGDPRRDESAVARSVAEQLATNHHVISVGEEDALSVVADLPEVYDEPFADSSSIPTILLSRFVAQHVKVALSGDGGDEFFSGYRRHPVLQPLAASPRASSASIARIADTMTHTWWVRPQEPWRELRFRHADSDDLYLDLVGGTDLHWLRRLGRHLSPLTDLRQQILSTQTQDPRRWAEATDRWLYPPGDLLTKMDRASMSCGLEVRAPFLAPCIADWAADLPSDVVGTPGGKELPRSLLRRYHGPEVADHPKQGFSVPLPSWLRGRLSHLVDLACDGHLATSGQVDRRVVLKLRRALQRRFDRAATPLWTNAMFELWHEHWRGPDGRSRCDTPVQEPASER